MYSGPRSCQPVDLFKALRASQRDVEENWKLRATGDMTKLERVETKTTYRESKGMGINQAEERAE